MRPACRGWLSSLGTARAPDCGEAAQSMRTNSVPLRACFLTAGPSSWPRVWPRPSENVAWARRRMGSCPCDTRGLVTPESRIPQPFRLRKAGGIRARRNLSRPGAGEKTCRGRTGSDGQGWPATVCYAPPCRAVPAAPAKPAGSSGQPHDRLRRQGRGRSAAASIGLRRGARRATGGTAQGRGGRQRAASRSGYSSSLKRL